MTFSMHGWYRWRGKDIVSVGTAHANLAYDRSDVQGGLGALDKLITYCTNNSRALGFRLRAIPWFTGTVPASSVLHLYVKGSFEGGDLYLPRYELDAWWEHYESVLQQAKTKIVNAGVELAFFDIDGLGHGGEAHFYNVTRPSGYVMPTRAHRKRMIDLTARMFGAPKLVVPTDNAEQVFDAFALHPDLGWRRDSLGRAHFKDGAVKKGVWETLKARARNPKAMVVAEWFGEDPPVNVALGLDQIKEAGVKLVGNGNFGVNADNNSTYLTNNAARFKAISDYLLAQRGISPTPTDPTEPPPPAPPPPAPADGSTIPAAIILDPPAAGSSEITTIALPALSGAVRGLTLAVQREELRIYTDQRKRFRWGDASGLVALSDLPTAANRAIRSFEGDFDYVACDGALDKAFPYGSVYDVRLMTSPQRCLAVGYSRAGKIVVPPEQGGTEYLIPTNSTSNQPGVWHYKNGSWALKATGLPTGVTWFQAVASPLNPDHWAVFAPEGAGGSAVWITLDAGATWQSAGVPGRTVHPPLTSMTTRFEWREDDANGWVAIFGTTGGTAHFVYGRGITTTATYGFSYKDVFVAIPAAHGEVFRYNDFGNSYIKPDGTTVGVSGRTALIGRHEWGDHDGGTSLRLAQSARQDGLRVVGTTDYRTGGTDSVLLKTTDAGAYWINFAAGKVYYVIQERIRRLIDPFTAPVESSQTTARGVTCLRQARQDRLKTVNLAGRSHGTVDAPFDGLEVSSDGTTWTSLAGPSGVTGLVNWVEVITRA